MTESHSHCKNTRNYATIVRYLIADNGTTDSIHDKPDICFYTTYFDIGFISSEHIAFFIVVVINEWFDADSCSFTVVCYLLMGDVDVI